jgi:hypothetical protein
MKTENLTLQWSETRRVTTEAKEVGASAPMFRIAHSRALAPEVSGPKGLIVVSLIVRPKGRTSLNANSIPIVRVKLKSGPRRKSISRLPDRWELAAILPGG